MGTRRTQKSLIGPEGTPSGLVREPTMLNVSRALNWILEGIGILVEMPSLGAHMLLGQ